MVETPALALALAGYFIWTARHCQITREVYFKSAKFTRLTNPIALKFGVFTYYFVGAVIIGSVWQLVPQD